MAKRNRASSSRRWSPNEEGILIQACASSTSFYTNIEALLPGRTPGSIHQKLNKLLRRQRLRQDQVPRGLCQWVAKHKQATLEAEPPALAKKFKLGQTQKLVKEGSKGRPLYDPPTGANILPPPPATEKVPSSSPRAPPAPPTPITLTLLAPDPSTQPQEELP